MEDKELIIALKNVEYKLYQTSIGAFSISERFRAILSPRQLVSIYEARDKTKEALEIIQNLIGKEK